MPSPASPGYGASETRAWTPSHGEWRWCSHVLGRSSSGPKAGRAAAVEGSEAGQQMARRRIGPRRLNK